MSGLSPVEEYLGRLFDHLAGQGAAGRRLLVETEDHLRCAVADLEERGLDREAAEGQAVARFGSPADLARQLEHATALPWHAALARVIGAAWLLAVVGLLSLGGSAVLARGAAALWGRSAIVTDPPTAQYTAARCQYLLEYYPQPDANCRNASVAHHYEEELRNRLACGVLGVLALGVFVLTRRGRNKSRVLGFLRFLRPLTATPPSGIVVAVASLGFGAAMLFSIGAGVDDFAIGRPWGAWGSIASGVALLPAAVWFTYRTLAELRTP